LQGFNHERRASSRIDSERNMNRFYRRDVQPDRQTPHPTPAQRYGPRR
jgi:predicted DNA-binding WGR domain protein